LLFFLETGATSALVGKSGKKKKKESEESTKAPRGTGVKNRMVGKLGWEKVAKLRFLKPYLSVLGRKDDRNRIWGKSK